MHERFLADSVSVSISTMDEFDLISPKFSLFDKPVPPLSGQRAATFAPNKPHLIPTIKNAYGYPFFTDDAWIPQYAITAANRRGTILHPISTVLPLGSPTLLANLQDYCTEIVPFAVQTQQWVRDAETKRVGRPKGVKTGRGRGKTAEKDSREGGNGDGSVSTGTGKNPSEIVKTNEDFANELDNIPDRDITLLDAPFQSMPLYRYYRPYRGEIERLKEEGRRAAVYTGIPRVSHINSPVNWYFSGGAVGYVSFAPERGFVISPKGTLSGVLCLPVTVNDERTGSRVVEAGPAQETVTEDLVYQIVPQNLADYDSALIGIRHISNCSILQQLSSDTPGLTYKTVLQRDDTTVFSHLASSPFVMGEFLTTSQNGYVTLWDVEMNKHVFEMNIDEMGFRKAARHQWVGCYFGSGGRDFGVLTNAGVEVFDRRLKDGRAAMAVLMTRGVYTHGVENDIVAAHTLPGDKSFYHVMATTREMCVVDQRYAREPVLRYPSPAPTPTMYLSYLENAISNSDMIITGAQMAQTCTCYELNAPEGLPLTIASLPFCSATTRQLVERFPLWMSNCDFPTQERLRKPLIGMTPIPHLNGDGFSLTTVSACGDLFVQSFEVVASADYQMDQYGTKAHFDTELDEAEGERWMGWIKQARGKVSDASTKSYLRVFQPPETAKVTEELGRIREMCAGAVKRQPHPLCLRCVPRDGVDVVERAEEVCPRCLMRLGTAKRKVQTANLNRFVFVTEDYPPGQPPVELPAELRREDRFRQLALTNRIAHRIAVHCYHENISDANLLPKAENKFVLPVKPGRARKSTVEDENLRRMLLERADNLEQAENARNISPPPLFASQPRETQPVTAENTGREEDVTMSELPDLPASQTDMFPLATSTQEQTNDIMIRDTVPPESATKRKARKPARISGF